VILKSVASKRSLRITPDGNVDGQGAEGEWAKFTVVRTGPFTIKLRSVGNPNHWLRFNESHLLDGHGQGGPRCDFRIEWVGHGMIRLVSTLPEQRVVSVLENGYPDNSFPPSPNRSLFVVKVAGQEHKLRDGSQIRLKSLASKKNLRINQQGHVDGNGLDGVWATFIVHRVDRNRIKLQSVGNSQHWLRIRDGVLDGQGVGGPWTEFNIKRQGGGIISLESVKQPGHFVGILPDGCSKPPSATGTGPHGSFKVIKA